MCAAALSRAATRLVCRSLSPKSRFHLALEARGVESALARHAPLRRENHLATRSARKDVDVDV